MPTSSLIHALGWTLFHSLWQGLAVALVVALFLPKMRSARLRYRLAFGSLASIFVFSFLTFFNVLNHFKTFESAKNEAAVSSLFPKKEATPTVAPTAAFFEKTSPDFLEKSRLWFEANHPFIVGLWMLGFAFFLLKLLGGWLVVEKLKTRRTAPLADDFTEMMRELASKIPLERPVRLLESALVAVPLTIGWLKPVILLPIGLVNQLSIEEVEAILAHELVHIARRDWLLNLAQSFIETLFYFHPAVWWLGSVIRAERENVADDLALALTGGSAVGYAKTLVRLQETTVGNGSGPVLALAFSGQKRGGLLARVQRILIQQQPYKSLAMEKIAATSVILALAVGLSLQANPAKPMVEKLATLATSPVEFFQNLSTPEKQDSIQPRKLKGNGKLSYDNGTKAFQVELKNDKIVSLHIDGKDIPATEFSKYELELPTMIDQFVQMPAEPPKVVHRLGFLPPMPADAPDFPRGFAFASPPNFAFDHRFDFNDLDNDFEGVTMTGTFNDDCDLRTETDAQGVFHLNFKKDKPLQEITVQPDGKAFFNGKPLADGEEVTIFSKNDDNDFFAFSGKHAFKLKNGKLTWQPSDAPELRKKLEAEAAQMAIDEAQNGIDEARNRPFERQERRREREIELQEQIMVEREEATRDREERARQREEDARNREADARERRHEIRKEKRIVYGNGSSAGGGFSYGFGDAVAAADAAEMNDDARDSMRDLLREDGFDPHNFSLKMTAKSLKINGKKQSSEMFEKYKAAYEMQTGKPFTESSSISISENSN